MAKFGKWIGGGLGWVLGGPIGGLIGFGIGSLFDNAEISVVQSGQVHGGRTTRSGDFAVSLLVLSAAVMKSDGRTLKSELDYVATFFKKQFGAEVAQQQMLLLREILQKEIDLNEICHQIKQHMPLSARLQLLHYLYGISNADGELHPNELNTIQLISSLLGIPRADAESIKAMYFRDVNSDYKILEIQTDASPEEIKKAYRRMAMKYHPDKVAGMGESVEKSAQEKFRSVKDAYDNIKKARNIS